MGFALLLRAVVDEMWFIGIGSYVESGNTADLLDSVKVFDLNGNGIPISDLWKDRKAVVAFARHFGYLFELYLIDNSF